MYTGIVTFDRVVAVRIFDVLFVNVYMPCEDGSITAVNTIHEILANICNIVEPSTAEFIIFGGDLNVNIAGHSAHAVVINDFLLTYKLKLGNDNAKVVD